MCIFNHCSLKSMYWWDRILPQLVRLVMQAFDSKLVSSLTLDKKIQIFTSQLFFQLKKITIKEEKKITHKYI